MHKFKSDKFPKSFIELIKKPKQKYPTKFSKTSYTSKSFSQNNMKYCISVRGPKHGMDFRKPKERKFNHTHLTRLKLCIFEIIFLFFYFLFC